MSSVVVARRENDDLCFGDQVDEAMFVVDSPRPGPGQVVFERLGPADAGDGIRPYVFDELIDACEHLAVGPDPGGAVLPALVFEYQPPRRYRASASPGSALATSSA